MEENWDKLWQRKSSDNIAKVIEKELLTVRWRKIKKSVQRQFGSFKDLEVIEIGCGGGTVSMLMAMEGANITLLDYSQAALDMAKKQFSNMDLQADYLLADALNLPSDICNYFDISMSFGLAEHFTGSSREKIILSHKRTLKENGLSFISVPNAYCFPYRIYKKIMEMSGLWTIGFEQPFTRSELRKKAEIAGFKKIELFGGAFISDINYFLFRNAKRIITNKLNKRPINTELDIKVKREISSFMDDYLGYSLVLAAYN